MKILSVASSMISDNAMWWRIINISKILSKNDHEIDFLIFTKENEVNNKDILNEIENYTFINFKNSYKYLKHLIKLKNENYDIIYGNTHSGAILSLISKKLGNLPLFFDIHGGLVAESQLNNDNLIKLKFKKLLETLSLYNSDELLCVSKKMMKIFNIEMNRTKNISYIPNGVELNFFKPYTNDRVMGLKQKMKLEDKFVFGYMGGFQNCQGAENLLYAAEKCDQKNIVFLFVGGDICVNNKNIIAKSFVNRELLLDYYAVSDVLVLPRPYHLATEIAAPTKFAEYTAMGKPVLTTNVGDAAGFVRDYDCGLVAGDNQPDSLLEQMLIFENMDYDQLMKMGSRSRELATKEFDWEIIGKKLINLMNRYEDK